MPSWQARLRPLLVALSVLTVGLVAAPLVPRTYQLVLQAMEIRGQSASIDALIEHPSVHDVANPDILDTALYEPIEGTRKVLSVNGRLIVALGTRACRFCDATWRAWREAIQRAWATDAPDVWYVPLDGETAVPADVSALSQRETIVKRMRLSDRRLYSARTGVRVVPMTLVFVSANQPACVVSGIPDRSQLDRCTSATPATMRDEGTLFFRNRASRELFDMTDRPGAQSELTDLVPVP